jgi:hypothetical protein
MKKLLDFYSKAKNYVFPACMQKVLTLCYRFLNQDTDFRTELCKESNILLAEGKDDIYFLHCTICSRSSYRLRGGLGGDRSRGLAHHLPRIQAQLLNLCTNYLLTPKQNIVI